MTWFSLSPIAQRAHKFVTWYTLSARICLHSRLDQLMKEITLMRILKKSGRNCHTPLYPIAVFVSWEYLLGVTLLRPLFAVYCLSILNYLSVKLIEIDRFTGICVCAVSFADNKTLIIHFYMFTKGFSFYFMVCP